MTVSCCAVQQLDISRFLLVVHEYFTSLGVDEIRRRGAADEKSLRMVKTLVHELCKCLVRSQALDQCRVHAQTRLCHAVQMAHCRLVFR